jgi:hypothetical protein
MPFDCALDGVIGQCQALAASRLQKDLTVHFKYVAWLASSLIWMLRQGRNIQSSSLLSIHYSTLDILVRQILVVVGSNFRMVEEFCQSLTIVTP